MISLKRVALLFVVSVVVICLLVFLKTTFGENQLSASSNLRLRVLRRKDQRHIKPTQEEVAIGRGQLKEERTLENKIPKHLPIKVKIKAEKEQAFKDIDNAHWARDLELEVTNSGTKPIYWLVLLLTLPEAQINSGKSLFSLHYGRIGLSMFNDNLETAKPEDVPIKPGETYIFKIHDGQRRGWERFQARQGWPNPKKIVVEFEQLSFGDGTGYRWVEGVAWPPADKKVSINRCQPKPSRNAKAHHARSQCVSNDSHAKAKVDVLKFASPNFSRLGASSKFATVKSEAAPDCCPSGCQWVKEYDSETACYGIGCDKIHRVDVLPCGDSGKCRKVQWTSQTCVVYEPDYDYEHECPFAKTSDCGSTAPPPGGGSMDNSPGFCNEYFWQWFISFDGGDHWDPIDQWDYAGCW